ncbi:MAG: hypothetical protein AB1744_10280, partial [Candidatus Zixiibacteriota bacterium]
MNSGKKDSLAEGWPQARQFRKSIRLEFSLYLSGVILVLMLITGYVITDQYVKTVTRDVVEKLLVQARSYSGPAGKHIISSDGPDMLMLNNICKKLSGDNPDVYWTGITGQDGVFLAHTDIRQVVAGAEMPVLYSEQFGQALKTGENFSLRSDTIYISIPIVENGITLGRLGVASSVRQVVEAQRTSIVTVASITLLMILLGIPLAMFTVHRKLRPVSIITDNLRKIDFESISLDIPVKTRNEFGYLAETLRVMGSKLNVAQRERVERERVARELEIAREIQANILPRDYPKTSQFEFYGTYRSAREVGG